jgi:3-phenylpropionate/trans-cinnamate dioxygenase ferredoxin reductase subunit
MSAGHDAVVVRGRPEDRSFACCYLKGDELLAIDCVNNPKDYMAGKRLIAERARVDRVRLADPSVALKDVVIP